MEREIAHLSWALFPPTMHVELRTVCGVDESLSELHVEPKVQIPNGLLWELTCIFSARFPGRDTAM